MIYLETHPDCLIYNLDNLTHLISYREVYAFRAAVCTNSMRRPDTLQKTKFDGTINEGETAYRPLINEIRLLDFTN